MVKALERSQAMRCKHCGNPNPDDHRFCGMCGQHLEERAVEPPARKAEPERSRDVSYLLDEAEEEKPGGLGRILLLVFGVALIGGFGYMYWLSGGKTATGKPVPSPDTLPNPANTAATKVPAVPETTVPQVKPEDAKTEVNKAAEAAPAASDQPAAAAAPPAQAQPAPVIAKPARLPVARAATKPPPKPVLSKAVTAASSKPVQIVPPKPSADLVTQAEKLVYGDGVPQDCDRGLGTMRPLAAMADPRAMIALGALYTTGTCVPRDLPTAYSWYAKALHKTPDNLTLEQDMKQIWGQMTPPERQLAIRLSQ